MTLINDKCCCRWLEWAPRFIHYSVFCPEYWKTNPFTGEKGDHYKVLDEGGRVEREFLKSAEEKEKNE